MTFETLSVDGDSQVIGLGIHDALLKGLRLDREDQFELEYETTSGDEKTLRFSCVHQIGFKDFTSGMILSEVFAWRLRDFVEGSGRIPVQAFHVLYGSNYRESDHPGLVRRILTQAPDAFLVLIESSFGGSIAVICDALIPKPPRSG